MERNVTYGNNSTFEDLTTFYSRQSEFIMGISFLILSFIGIVGNTYTILVMLFRKRLYNCCTPYLISVSMSDLVMTGLILPIVGINAITGKVFVPPVLCKWLSIFYHNILATSWLGLAMVSVVRCAGIWTNNKCCLLRWTGTSIALTWLLPVLTNTYLVFVVWGSDEHLSTGYTCWFFCGIERMIQDHQARQHHQHQQAVLWLSSFYSIFPLAIMIISYFMIWYKIRLSNDALKQSGSITFNKHKNEVRFTRMIGIIFGNYILFTLVPSSILIKRVGTMAPDWLPKLTKALETLDNLKDFSSNIISIYDPLVYIIFYTPFVSNPFIYVLSNRCYREAYKDFFFKNVIPKFSRSSEERSKSMNMEMNERFN